MEAPPSIGPEMELANTAAYPEGSYVVRSGDTLKGIAAKLGVDYTTLLHANGFTDTTVVKAGEVIIVPKVALRSPGDATVSGAVRSAPLSETRVEAKPDSSGRVLAVSAGTVTAVHRAYPGLGDVVIIESDAEKVIYGGAFAPSVVKGVAVSAGEAIGKAPRRGRVDVSRFPK
jgi:LysM repeat protein